MKGFYCGILYLVFCTQFSVAQTITSAQDGNWDSGTTWVGGVVPGTGNSVQIADGHNVIIPAGYDAQAASVSIFNSSATDLTIQNTGSLTFTGVLATGTLNRGKLFINGILSVEEGASITGTQLIVGATGIYRHNYKTTAGTVYPATWNAGSTLEIVGYTSNTATPTGLTQTFRNVTWNCPNQQNDIYLTGNTIFGTVNGNFNVANTNGFILGLQPTVNRTHNFNGDLNLSSGVIFDINSGTTNTTINLSGNLNVGSDDALAIQSAGVGTIYFTGTAAKTVTSVALLSTPINFEVSTSAVVSIPDGNFLSGPGDFTLDAGGTLQVGSVDGLAIGTGVGNIQVSGMRNYAANATIVYNGLTSQNLGDEWSSSGGLNGVAVNLTIANSSGVTNNITGTTSLVGKLTLSIGALNIGNANTLQIEGDFEGYNGSTRTGTISGFTTPTPSSSLVFGGSGAFTGTLNFTAGLNSLKSLTINRAGTITLGTDLTLVTGGTLAFSSSGNLDFGQTNGQTLTINGDITQGGSGGLYSGATFPANLSIGGSGSLTALPFCSSCGSVELTNVTLNRTGSATYPWSAAVTVRGMFDLVSGTLAHSSGLIMTSTSTFRRSAGTSVTISAPNASPSYNVSYVGTNTTSLELPSGSSTLNNLSIAGNVTLDKGITINGDLSISSGTLDASTFDLTVAGRNFLVNGGAFTMGTTHTITFSAPGTTTLDGTTISGIQFGNLSISSLTTLSAPNANINIAGTWDNLGTFSANTGTVTFNGGAQNIDANGQPFYNVTVGGSGTKTLLGALDVNNALTIASTLDAGGNQPIFVGGSWINNGTFLAEAGTVTFDGAAQDINSKGQAFYNLELSNSGTKTVAGTALNIDGSLTIAGGVTLDVSSGSLPINIAGNWINNGTFSRRTGTVTFDGTSAISGSTQSNFYNVTLAGALTASAGTSNIHGDWVYTSGSFNANSGTIQFLGANQSITPGGQAFNNVVIGGSLIKTLQGDITINGNLTLSTSAATFSLGTNRTVSLLGNFDASGGGILSAQSGSFIFAGGEQTITSAGERFFNVTFSGSGTKTLADAFDADGNVNIMRPIAAGANAINVAGNWNATVAGSLTSTGTTTFDGLGQTIRSNASSFGNLVLAGSGTKTLQDALDANGNLTVTSATLDASTGNFPITVGGDWYTFAGTFTPQSGLVTLDGAAQNITLGSNSFNSLTIAGNGVKTIQDALDVNGNLTFANGTSGLNVGSDQAVRVAGNWINNSGITTAFTAGNGTVTFDGGSTSDVSGTGNTNFHSIDVTGNTSVEIESAQSLTGTLTLVGVSSRFNAVGSGSAGVFTLKSSNDNPTVDARIATLSVPSNFTGNVTVQRFMSRESMPTFSDNRLYRYISSPVSNAAVSQLQSEIPITGSFTGASTCSGCKSTSPSMYAYDETAGTTFDDGWVEFPDASNTETLTMGKGYGVYVRGDIISSALWDVRGPIFSGNVNLPVTYEFQGVAGADGFNLVGNPYPSAIDWDLIHAGATNIANAVYIRDNPNGRYAEYVNGIGANGGTKDIAMGQGFWVQATGASPQLPLTESMKSSAAPSFFRVAPPSELLRIELANATVSDETVIRFHDSATDLFDPAYDAWKLQNTIFNLSSVLDDSTRLSINTLGSMECGREIKLSVADVTTGHYDFTLSGLESFADNVSIKLIDNYLGQTVDARTTAIYGFNVDTNVPSTFGQDRFKVVFEFNSVILQPKVLSADVCQGSDASVQIANTFPEVNYAIYSEGNLITDIGPGGNSDLTITIPKDKLLAGDNVFELRAVNSFCDQINLNQEFTIVTETLPEVASVQGSSACQSGAVDLTATGADEGDFRWYETSDATTPIEGATGGVFTTPELSKTSTYYVAAVNSLGCEGPKKEVVAEVISFDPVIITESEGQLKSSYIEGNQWYKDGELIPGATGQTYTPEEAGTYSVEIPVGKCTTSAQRVFLVTGNDEELSNGKLNIYPNPVKGELVIHTLMEQSDPPSIFDQTGKLIGTVKMAPSQDGWIGRYDFSEKTKGLYLLKIIEKGIPRYKRIIKE